MATKNEPRSRMSSGSLSTLMGAIFLMATSAIGPGFITQTTSFTVELGAAFALAILISLLIDIALQLNVWRVIGVSGLRAQELGNRVLPGLGWVMAALLLIGGFVFNVGNVAGAGLGTNALLGVDPRVGAPISALIAIGVFLSHKAGVAMDRVVLILGVVMIVVTTYVAYTSRPPVGEALRNVVAPEQFSVLATTTLIGGTIGGYIVYAGAHRLLDSGISGPGQIGQITRASVTGIIVTGAMRGWDLRAGAVGGLDHQHHRGVVHDRLVPHLPQSHQRPGPSRVGGRLHRVNHHDLRDRRSGADHPAGLCRCRDLLRGYDYPRWLVAIGALAWLVTIYLAISAVGPVLDLFS